MSKFRGGALGSPVPRRGGKGGKTKTGLDEEAMEEIKEVSLIGPFYGRRLRLTVCSNFLVCTHMLYLPFSLGFQPV